MLEVQESELKSKDGLSLSNFEDQNTYKSNILKMYVYQIFIGFHMISGVFLPFFLNWGKLEFIEVMFLQSYFTMMILIFEIPCGAISDYLSRKLSLILGGISTALASLVYSTFPNIFIFAMGETLFALGFSLISGTDQSLIYLSLKMQGRENEASKIIAKMRSFFILGITISAPIGSLIAFIFPLNFVFAFMIIPFIVAALIGLTFEEPSYGIEREQES